MIHGLFRASRSPGPARRGVRLLTFESYQDIFNLCGPVRSHRSEYALRRFCKKTPALKRAGAIFMMPLFREFLPGRIRGMQQLMSQVGIRLAEILLIQLDDLRIIVGLADHLSLIL